LYIINASSHLQSPLSLAIMIIIRKMIWGGKRPEPEE